MGVVLPTILGGAMMLSVASGPEEWAALHSGRLMHALDRDTAAAISVYEAVTEHLDEDDPLRADYLYWLGRAWFEAGEVDRARATLEAVDGRSPLASTARSLRARIDIDRARVPRLPAFIDPIAEPQYLVTGWGPGMTPFTVTKPAQGGPPTVSWPIATDDVRAGFLAIGVEPGIGSLDSVRFEARSTEVLLAARVVVETFDGRTFAGVPIVLRPGTWTEVSAPVTQLRTPRTGGPGLDRSAVNMVAIELAPVDPGAMSTSSTVLLRSIVLDGSS